MVNSSEVISILESNINYIDRFHVSKVALFGSFARDEQSDTSDVDILVEFEDGNETFDNYMEMKFYLEELFGRKVDLVTFNSIKPALRPGIMRSAKYAKGA